MLSSANLDFSGILIDLIAIVFFGSGILYILIIGINNQIKKKQKSGRYYLVSFFIAGIVAVLMAALIAFMWAMSL